MEKNINISNLSSSDSFESIESDLIKSFQSLIINTSGDMKTLEAFSTMIQEEIDRVSNHGSDTDWEHDKTAIEETPEDLKDNLVLTSQHKCTDNDYVLQNLVCKQDNYLSSDYLKDNGIMVGLNKLYEKMHHLSKYMWVTDHDISYSFGGKTYKPKSMESVPVIRNIMNKLNEDGGYKFDSCLIVRYNTPNMKISLHQDDEHILDSLHPISVITVGSTRIAEFWNSDRESTGSLVKKCELAEGSNMTMKPGCQNRLWHKVLCTNDKTGIRYALSFRKLKSKELAPLPTTTPHKQHHPWDDNPQGYQPHASTPVHNLLHNFGYQNLHPSRIAAFQNTISDYETSKVDNNPNKPSAKSTHLIIGDSLTKGLNIEKCITISKGGIHPKDVLKLLYDNTNLLDAECYEDIETVTLVVGTNSLNVSSPGRCIPLADIIFEYTCLVNKFIELFPNAKIGLFNVIPRACKSRDTFHRINLFNSIFQQKYHSYPNICWIKLYWEFVDYKGFLRSNLYGRDGVHLKPMGKVLMTTKIKWFQTSV